MKNLNQKGFTEIQGFLKRESTLTLMLIFFFLFNGYSQEGSGYGIKGGINYNANGDYFESIGSVAQEPDRNIGYHVGVFAKFGNQFYWIFTVLQPSCIKITFYLIRENVSNLNDIKNLTIFL